MKFILGKKIGMTQIYNEAGNVVPVTLVEAGPCVITQIKKEETDGYIAVQIGFEELKKNKVKKPQADKPYRFFSEFCVEDIDNYKKGEKIDVSIFEKGEKVKIAGISKGKGFQGVVKRYGFSGQDKTHGTKHEERGTGSIGSAYPQRVFKGRKMPGRMGSDRTTVKNLKVIDIDPAKNLIALKGALPGGKGNLLEIQAL